MCFNLLCLGGCCPRRHLPNHQRLIQMVQLRRAVRAGQPAARPGHPGLQCWRHAPARVLVAVAVGRAEQQKVANVPLLLQPLHQARDEAEGGGLLPVADEHVNVAALCLATAVAAH